jgi:Na+-translocating ferredoxin:NAD+ oxidoreductase RnfD subunit
MSTIDPGASLTSPSPLRRWFSGLSPKWLITLLITLILLVAQIQVDLLASYWVLPATVGAAMVTEVVLSAFVRGRVAHVQSAYISGISMTILTKPQQDFLWPFVLGAAIWPLLVIWSVGLLVASRARILHVTFAYLAAFLVLTAGRAALTGESFTAEVAPLTGPMYQLFLLFMITDPATTVSSKRGRILVAVLIAICETGIRLIDELPTTTPLHTLLEAPPIFALAIVGPIAKWWDLRRNG